VLVFNDNLVLALVGRLDLGDGHHDHVVVVAVADQLVPPTFLDHCGTLIELEGWGGVALNEHVATGSLVFHCTVLLLDLHNPWWSGVPDSLEGNRRLVQPSLPLRLLVTGCIFASTPPPLCDLKVGTRLFFLRLLGGFFGGCFSCQLLLPQLFVRLLLLGGRCIRGLLILDLWRRLLFHRFRLDGDLSCAFVASALVLENNLEVAHVVHGAGGDEQGGVGAVEADQAAL